jgi:hypothetical protein
MKVGKLLLVAILLCLSVSAMRAGKEIKGDVGALLVEYI